MSEEIKEQEIKVSEEKDGSATFEVPEGLLPEEAEEEPKAEEQKAQGGEADESDEDHPDDTDAVREARRARRRAKKDYIKKTNQEKDQRLVLLARQNQELMARLAAIEKKSHISDIARTKNPAKSNYWPTLGWTGTLGMTLRVQTQEVGLPSELIINLCGKVGTPPQKIIGMN